jgi:aminoglycoside phosphotransferase (APT) family kinase protein
MDSPSNDVGVQFIVMEYIEGVHLYRIWDDLTLDQRKGVLFQIAGVLGQLASLEFDAIGSIKEDGSVGPLSYRILDEIDGEDVTKDMLSGPFRSTSDYLSDFIDRFSRSGGISDEGQTQLSNVRNILAKYLASHADELYTRPPFRLQHHDFDAQNFIFTDPSLDDSTSPLRLIGVIDWDYAHTSPLYFHTGRGLVPGTLRGQCHTQTTLYSCSRTTISTRFSSVCRGPGLHTFGEVLDSQPLR